MRILLSLIIFALLCSFTQSESGFDIQLEKQSEGLTEALEHTLAIRLDPFDTDSYRVSFENPERASALQAFFDAMPYARLERPGLTQSASKQLLYAERTLLRVRLEPNLSAAERAQLSAVYLTSFWTMRGEALGGQWTVVPTPKGVTPEAFAAALEASPMIQEVATRLERKIERERNRLPSVAPDRKD